MLPAATEAREAPNPYARPRDDEVALFAATGAAGPEGYKAQEKLTRLIVACLSVSTVLVIVVNVLAAVAFRMRLGGDTFELLVGVVDHAARGSYYLYLATIVPFSMFLVQANKNARTFGAALRFSPASMVWWFAVPFLNFVRPYQAVKEVWDASLPAKEGIFTRSGILSLWWGLWLCNMAVARFVGYWTAGPEYDEWWLGSAIDGVCSVALNVAAAVMVTSLRERQALRAADELEQAHKLERLDAAPAPATIGA